MEEPQLENYVIDGPTRLQVLDTDRQQEYFFRASGRADSRRVEGIDVAHPKLEVSIKIYNSTQRNIQIITGDGGIPKLELEKSLWCLRERFLIDPRRFAGLSALHLVPDVDSLSHDVVTELARQHAERADPTGLQKLVVTIKVFVDIIYPEALRMAASTAAIGRLTKRVLEEKAEDLDECPICAEGYVVGQTMASLPCLHAYHTDCIDKWLQRKPTCPYCRADFGS